MAAKLDPFQTHYKSIIIVFTFACWSHSIKITSSTIAISRASPCLATNQSKPRVATVSSLYIEIVAVVLTGHIRIRHRAIG